MNEQHNEPLSPTLTKLLDAYLEALTVTLKLMMMPPYVLMPY